MEPLEKLLLVLLLLAMDFYSKNYIINSDKKSSDRNNKSFPYFTLIQLRRRMKKYLLGGLIMISAGSAFGMESKSIIKQNDEFISVFYLPELQLPILEFLLKILPAKEALLSIKAWSSVTKKSYEFFRQPQVRKNLIALLYKLSYYDYFNMSLFPQIHTLLRNNELTNCEQSLVEANTVVPNNELAVFEQSLVEANDLVKVFKECAHNNQWNTILTRLNNLEKTPLAYYLGMYYWQDSYGNFPAIKTLLVYALELDAPEEVIKILIRYGSSLTLLHPMTPPPCLIVCKKLSDIIDNSTKNCTKDHTDLAVIEQETGRLKRVINILIEAGASLNDLFVYSKKDLLHSRVGPLSPAIEINSLELVEYLLKKDCYSLDGILFKQALSNFLEGKLSLSVLKALIAIPDDLHPFLCEFLYIVSPLQDEAKKEKALILLPLLLNKIIDINRLYNEFTVLDIVLLSEADDRITAMLTEKGATTLATVESKLCALNTIDGKRSTLNTKLATLFKEQVTILNFIKKQDREAYYDEIPDFLERQTKEVLRNKLGSELKQLILYRSMGFAFDTLWLQESKEFIKFAHIQEDSFSIPFQDLQFIKLGYTKGGSSLISLTEDLRVISSAFQSAVIMFILNPWCIKNGENDSESAFTEVCAFISWLAKQGLKDTVAPGSKAADHIAEAYGISALADHIRYALR